MSESSNDMIRPQAEVLRELPAEYRYELPVEPGHRDLPPKGDINAGIRLSLLALEQVRNRPEIFAARDAQRCDVEFIL